MRARPWSTGVHLHSSRVQHTTCITSRLRQLHHKATRHLGDGELSGIRRIAIRRYLDRCGDAHLVKWFTHGAVDATSNAWQEMIPLIAWQSVLPPRYDLRKDGSRYTTDISFLHAEGTLASSSRLQRIASIDIPVDGDRIETSDEVGCDPYRACSSVMSELHGLKLILPLCQWLRSPSLEGRIDHVCFPRVKTGGIPHSVSSQ